MAEPAVGIRNLLQEQREQREWLSSRVRDSCERLRMQDVILFEVCDCSARLHDCLAGMKLKLKFRMNGITHLKARPGKASIGVDDELRINFDSIGGSAIFEGGEWLHFELCRAGSRASQTLASCAVPTKAVLSSKQDWSENGDGRATRLANESGTHLHLELVSLDTPGKVLASLTVYIGLRKATLDDAGGSQILQTPGLKLPAGPKNVSSVSALAWNDEAHEILDFVHKAEKVRTRLRAVHDATSMANMSP